MKRKRGKVYLHKNTLMGTTRMRNLCKGALGRRAENMGAAWPGSLVLGASEVLANYIEGPGNIPKKHCKRNLLNLL